MASKLKIGVIGTGFGTIVQIPTFQANPDTEVLAVCSARQERAQEAASRFGIPHAFTDYRELVQLPDLDVVTVTTPTYLHYPMVMAALEAGKHVLCEKPFAMNVQEALAMVEKAHTTGLVAMTDFEWRFSPGIVRAKELLQEQYIGEPRLVNVYMYVRWRWGKTGPLPYSWRYQKASGGGTLGSAGSHLIDMVRYLLGDFTGVVGQLHTILHERPDETGELHPCDADDTFHVSFMLQNGAPGALTGSHHAFAGGGIRIEIYGTHGTLLIPTLNDANPPYLLGALDGDESLQPLPIPERLLPLDDNLRVSAQLFTKVVERLVQAIKGEVEPSPSFEDGLCCQEILDAIRLSHKEERWVSLPL